MEYIFEAPHFEMGFIILLLQCIMFCAPSWRLMGLGKKNYFLSFFFFLELKWTYGLQIA